MDVELRKSYAKPALVDLGSIVDHTFCDPLVRPFKGGGPIVHCDKHNEWSGGTGPELGTCTCDTSRGGLGHAYGHGGQGSSGGGGGKR